MTKISLKIPLQRNDLKSTFIITPYNSIKDYGVIEINTEDETDDTLILVTLEEVSRIY